MSEPDPKPMRVSDWSRPAPTGSAPAAPVAPAAPATAALGHAAASTTPAAAPEEGPGLPVDPFRLLGGLWRRRYWVVIGLVVGTGLGAAAGIWRAQTRYAVAVQLIKREVPNAFRSGEGGEAFKPRQLSGATLVGVATSDNVLRRVADKSSPPTSLGLLRQSIEVKEQRGTDYVNLSLIGYASADATVKLANLWAQEVVDFSREMQSRESKEIRQYLQQQLESTDAELKRVNGAMLEYSRAQGLVAADKQIDAYLRSLGDLDLKYETARLELNATEFKIRSLQAELMRQSPLAERVKSARQDLEEARARFTDRNPLVLEKQEKVQALEAQLKQEAAGPDTDLSRFAGTFLGNTIYLQLLDAKGQQRTLTEQLRELDRVRETQRQALAAIPEKEMGLAQLARTKQSLETSRALIMGRLREAQLFEERAPGYYQVFLPASLESVDARGKWLKVLLYAVAGGVVLAGAAVGGALGLELLDGLLRTGAEAARALGAPLLGSIPRGGPDPAKAPDLSARIWIRWMGRHPAGGIVRLVWAPAGSPEEDTFWRLMLDEARRLRPDLTVVDFAPQSPPAALASLPAVDLTALESANSAPRRITQDPGQLSIEQARAIFTRLQRHAAAGRELWCRCEGPVREPLSSLARGTGGGLIVVALDAESLAFWREQAARLRQAGASPSGIVAVNAVEWHQR